MKRLLGIAILTSASTLLSAHYARIYQAVDMIDAVRAGDGSSVKALLDKGADANMRGTEGITPLLVAASTGNVEIAKALIAKGANVNAQDKSGWQLSPLMVASFSGRLDMVKLLLDKGADIELKNKDGNTALFFGTMAKESKPIVDLLVERGAKKLQAKTLIESFVQVGGLPLNSMCFEHIEGPRCNNAPKKTT